MCLEQCHATYNYFPMQFQAALLLKTGDEMYFCGGSLISKKFVLTAAHCVDKYNEADTQLDCIYYVSNIFRADEAQVILGAHNVTNRNETTQQVQISNTFVVHKYWGDVLVNNDIALIELPQEATLNGKPRYQ